MREYKKQLVERQDIVRLVCDRCGLVAERCNESIFELQEFLCWNNQCGYGSVFGDGNFVELDLCQKCVKELLGEHVRIIEEKFSL